MAQPTIAASITLPPIPRYVRIICPFPSRVARITKIVSLLPQKRAGAYSNCPVVGQEHFQNRPALLGQATVEYEAAQASLVFGGNTRFGPLDSTHITGTDGIMTSSGAGRSRPVVLGTARKILAVIGASASSFGKNCRYSAVAKCFLFLVF